MARDDIADFGTYLAEERHASQNTICSYLRDVTQFSAYLREHQSCTLRQAGGGGISGLNHGPGRPAER